MTSPRPANRPSLWDLLVRLACHPCKHHVPDSVMYAGSWSDPRMQSEVSHK